MRLSLRGWYWIGSICLGLSGLLLLLLIATFMLDQYDRWQATTLLVVPPSVTVTRIDRATAVGAVGDATPRPTDIAPNAVIDRTPVAAPATSAPMAATSVPTALPLPPVQAIVIPSISLNRTVVSVTFDATTQEWDVPRYKVGHHSTSAQPGDGGNIVLTGHVGGSDPVFDDLVHLSAGDQILVYRGATLYTYVVDVIDYIPITDVDPVTVAEAAQAVLGPTAMERLTLITCWPPVGADAYSQRLVVRALPVTNGESS